MHQLLKCIQFFVSDLDSRASFFASGIQKLVDR